jgi:hypothetical protein
MRHLCAARRSCQGAVVKAAGSRAVDQSSARNKRDDRLAEGHERVAGTVMVLRLLIEAPRALYVPVIAQGGWTMAAIYFPA